MYEFWFHYGKPKYWCNVKLCYTDKDNNIMHIKTEDVYKHITNDVEKRFDTSNYYIIIISNMDIVTSYLSGENAAKIYRTELLNVIPCNLNMKLLILMILQTKTKENIIQKWPFVPDSPYRILIIGGSISGKTNMLLNLINHQEDIDKIYLHIKDPSEIKYLFLIN